MADFSADGNANGDVMSDRNLTRRQFFRAGPRGILNEYTGRKTGEDVRPLIRPPGAVREVEFLQRCQSCHACEEACPHDAIFMLGPEYGEAEETPHMKPDEVPCHWCTEMDCIEACGSGALRLPADGLVAPIAVVEIDHDTCLVSQGILCDDCAMICPSHIGAITMKGRKPELNPDTCTGCGLCIQHCMAEPTAIRLISKPRA